MRAGKPAVEAYLGGLEECSRTDTEAKSLKLHANVHLLTPRHQVVDTHLVFDVVNFYNKQVKVDSLDERPAKGCQQKVLQKSGYCYTSTL